MFNQLTKIALKGQQLLHRPRQSKILSSINITGPHNKQTVESIICLCLMWQLSGVICKLNKIHKSFWYRPSDFLVSHFHKFDQKGPWSILGYFCDIKIKSTKSHYRSHFEKRLVIRMTTDSMVTLTG